MNKPNYEDLIMKKAIEIFAEEGLKFLGINKKVKESGPTEIVVLQAKNMFMDYTFLMEDDTYTHFEFQTTNNGVKDLRRFRTYEALLSHQENKHVTTYVIYSGDIKNPMTQFKCGINTYKVNVISMANEDGDKVFAEISDKLTKGHKIDKQDLMKLTFSPIMGGKLNKSEKIIKAIQLNKKINSEYRYDMDSILYAFANKFLKGKELEKIKEEVKMTELGKMLTEDAEMKKAREVAKKSLNMLDDEDIASITGLDIEEVKKIRKENSN